MRIAIVAYHFWPDEAIGAVRPENWARWLSDGHEVFIITREMPVTGNHDLPFRIVRQRSFLIRFIDLMNRLRKSRRQRANATGASKKGKGSIGVDASRPSGIFTYRMPCLYDAWLPAVLSGLRSVHPDIVIATHSPYVDLVASWIYTKLKRNSKLWIDFRDLWVGSHQAVGFPIIRKFEAWLEKRIANDAAAISVVSNGLANYFVEAGFGSKTHVIYNAPHNIEVSHEVATQARNEDNALVITYTGTIYSIDRDPGPLFELIKYASDRGDAGFKAVSVRIASRNPGDLFQIVAKHGAESFVEFVGAVSRQRSIEMQNQADVLLLLESNRPEAKGVLTGKLFEYLASGKPILLLGPGPDSELYQLLSSLNRLLTLEDFREIIIGSRQMPTYEPIDFSETSRKQLMAVVESLE